METSQLAWGKQPAKWHLELSTLHPGNAVSSAIGLFQLVLMGKPDKQQKPVWLWGGFRFSLINISYKGIPELPLGFWFGDPLILG